MKREEEWEDALPPRRRGRRPGLGESAAKGAIAGLIGGAAMMLAMKAEQKLLLSELQQSDPPPKRFVEAVAGGQGVSLSERQAMAAGMGVHMGYSALWGALYGVVQERLDPPELLHGLVLGGLVYAVNFPEWGLLPKVGVLPPPSQQDPREAAVPLIAHAVFGVATARAFDALR